MNINGVLGYFWKCVALGIYIPWMFLWVLYVILFIIGIVTNPLKTKKLVSRTFFICICYLVATPVLTTLVAVMESVFGMEKASIIFVGEMPQSAPLALIHATIMWGFVSFYTGAILRGVVEQAAEEDEPSVD